MSSVTTSTASLHDTPPPPIVPRMQSSSSLQSMARRTAPPPTARSRSGSLGVLPPSSSRRVTAMTIQQLDHPLTMTLVVVGTPGCGKSTVIRKGLKGFQLSEPTPSLPGTHALRYTKRIGRLPRTDEPQDCPLIIIEVDIPTAISDTLSAMDLLPEPTRIDGVLICYSASDEPSFRPVEALLRGYRQLQLPTVVVACKSDLPKAVDPLTSVEILLQYDVGLIEVNNTSDAGTGKMRRSFDWLLKAVLRDRLRNQLDDYRNPASPNLVANHPAWESASRTSTPVGPLPTPSSTSTSTRHGRTPSRVPSADTLSSGAEHTLSTHSIPESQVPTLPLDQETPASTEHDHSDHPPTQSEEALGHISSDERKPPRRQDARPAQWATLDELLDKLLFLAVSGDDPTYITHFLLTYRRFASPRSVLLAMQKRMRQLDSPSGDPMFACYAQMRICHLLEVWIRDYPYDFAVRGTAGALSALIKSIISKTYLLHYGSDFLPFLEMLPSLVDKDADWAHKADEIEVESDDSYSLLEDDDDKSPDTSPKAKQSQTTSSPVKDKLPAAQRERKGSLPLTAKALLPSLENTLAFEQAPETPKQQLKELQRLAAEVNLTDPEELAKEITRLEAKLFLDIEPRHWLHYTFVSGKKDPEVNSIARFNNVSNHLADWVVSLILCHDKPRMRAKQIEKFVEIAQKLRSLNNYSALRAFVAGINNATYPGDPTLDQFKSRCPEQAKNLQSWDVLLQHIRAHRAYRLALRNTKGACIPALEVHISDLIRSHEANPDMSTNDPSRIHWGKFNMIGRFITSTTQCQAQCRSTQDYNFSERPDLRNMLLVNCLMDNEMQKSRITPPDGEYDDYRPARPQRDPSAPRDVAILRRLLFW
ncbi:ras GEF [Cylindrobasidium torrendii FP15055 ss-10]|uniref:Ras GEF n=1 Tax=Cylindrobasidium torrendii FP15055 ss-10 TaxID=1314674 RepID=A0A0D7BN40_9AGAR|nr:ras GEF [Cylindrobasidium torrendii FP15055 ss-10]